jgi:tetratricopeptide (TPR) repeat protein/predicted aspartyl protease
MMRSVAGFGGIRMGRAWIWVGAAAAIATASPALAANCQLQKMLEVPVQMRGLEPTISAKINGHDVTLGVGTGNFFSSVPEATAAATGMTPTSTPFGMQVTGLGGRERDARAVKAHEFMFAGGLFRDIDFLVWQGGGDGVLGQNVMGPFDVEYDFANGVMRIFKATDCRDANLAYWAAGKNVSRISLDGEGKYLNSVVARAKIDGHPIRVKFSSGSGLSYLSRPAAARAGVKAGAEGVAAAGVIYGAYGKALDMSIATFQSFAIGDEEIKNARLRVVDSDMTDSDMLLGTDFFLSHRILISNTQKKVYFTYNGGPVFQLERAGQQQAKAEPPPASAPPGGGAGQPSGTAAELVGQASGLAARREFPAAIATFSRAIEQDPNNAAAYRGRALARLQNRQPVLGMADLDSALKLQPNDVETLLLRGRLYLQAKDTPRAEADFDAAVKASLDSHSTVRQIAAADIGAGQYEPAIKRLDGWLAAHPKDAERTALLAERCNARATWGHELEAALADCDAAVKAGGKASTALENRGIVLLRMGRVDDAIRQFDAALSAQPKAAWAFYGRGVAKAKKGDKAGADADFAAAVAIRPDIASLGKRYGLAEDGTITAAGPSGG